MTDYIRMLVDVPVIVSRVWEAVEFLEPRIERLPGGVSLPEWAAPSLALGALLAMLILSGTAIGSIALALTALLLIALLLDQIFGVTVEVR